MQASKNVRILDGRTANSMRVCKHGLTNIVFSRECLYDILSFADDLHEMKIDEQDILVSFDVSSLFTNVPVDETIEMLAEKGFKDNWFNKEYDLNITKTDLIELLEVATKNQLFQFEGNLFEQVDGVAMGSPLGPLMANAFMCNIEEKLENQNKMPAFYKRYVDDTLSKMPDVSSASEFLLTLNEIRPSCCLRCPSRQRTRGPVVQYLCK